jgi:hypothetical protein
MNKVLPILLILSSACIASAAIAQEIAPHYLDPLPIKFKDGVYANINMVKSNSPLSPTWIETELEVDDRDFYRKITRDEGIVFFDDNGVRTVFETKRIWGYGDKGDLHINVGGVFHEIDFIGPYSHFIASKTTYDPFFYTEENPPLFYYFTPPVVTLKNREYIVDIENNKAWEFDSDGLERVLKKDTLLLEEFRALKKREKEFLKYIYLNRYNEKHPLDIPFH